MASEAGLKENLRELGKYSACDVSDALLKLQKPASGEVARAGYLADIQPFALGKVPLYESHRYGKVIAPARTLKLVSKGAKIEALPEGSKHAVPKGSHWADITESGTILVIEQPEGQGCAAVGGIMAQKMKFNGVEACVVSGRVRDQQELKDSELPIFATGKSTVGSGAESSVYGHNLPVTIKGVKVSPGDIVFCDPSEGVVVIPQDLLDDTIQLMPRLVAADDKVKEAVKEGMAVAVAFKKFRG
ncbi:hypothetical protein DV736_g1412, partial [Chaetothyriales sp. CBS 134916]